MWRVECGGCTRSVHIVNTRCGVDDAQVTAEMAAELVVELKRLHVEFLVAPYEADAQMAWLADVSEARGGVAAVITEDSDLLCYGAVRAVLFKVDRAGACMEVQRDHLFGISRECMDLTDSMEQSRCASSITPPSEGSTQHSGTHRHHRARVDTRRHFCGIFAGRRRKAALRPPPHDQASLSWGVVRTNRLHHGRPTMRRSGHARRSQTGRRRCSSACMNPPKSSA